MNSIFFTTEFKRKVKLLAKIYHTLKGNIDQLATSLLQNPFLSNSYGANIYKIRLADESKGTGKSGSFRVITSVHSKSRRHRNRDDKIPHKLLPHKRSLLEKSKRLLLST